MSGGAQPVVWVRIHPDGTYTDEYLPDGAIEDVRKNSGAWVPLCADAGDGKRYRYLMANPDWRFIERICQQSTAKTGADFYREVSRVIDAAMRSDPDKRHDWPACAIFRGGKCTCD